MNIIVPLNLSLISILFGAASKPNNGIITSPGGEIVLAGFYSERVSFAFPAAFMREAHFRVAAEWQPGDLAETRALIECGRLDLKGLVTNRRPAGEALDAYPQAFTDPDCLKMVLDWSEC